METFLIKAAQLIAALALLVTIHELGHYFFARVFGIKVDKFYLFFNPWFSLYKYKPKQKAPKLNADGSERPTWRDTEYGIGWLPLGGYCKIAGMIDESMDTEQMSKEPQPWGVPFQTGFSAPTRYDRWSLVQFHPGYHYLCRHGVLLGRKDY